MGKLLELSQARLKELLAYDAETGVFTWRVSRGKAVTGTVAGWLDKDGYVVIGIGGREYRAHRLAWLWEHGSMPPLLDHRDQNRVSAVLDNLRPATKSQNGCNRGKPKSNKSGAKGVSLFKQTGKWRAQIMVLGKCIHLGLYPTVEEAKEVYDLAASLLHGEFANHG